MKAKRSPKETQSQAEENIGEARGQKAAVVRRLMKGSTTLVDGAGLRYSSERFKRRIRAMLVLRSVGLRIGAWVERAEDPG